MVDSQLFYITHQYLSGETTNVYNGQLIIVRPKYRNTIGAQKSGEITGIISNSISLENLLKR